MQRLIPRLPCFKVSDWWFEATRSRKTHQSNQKLVKKISKALLGGYSWRRLTVTMGTTLVFFLPIGDSYCFLFSLKPKMGVYHPTGYNENYMYLNMSMQTMPNGLVRSVKLFKLKLYSNTILFAPAVKQTSQPWCTALYDCIYLVFAH